MAASKSGLFLLIYISLFFLLPAQESPSQEAEQPDLDSEECAELYEHQLRVASSDPTFVLQPSISLSQEHLSGKEKRTAQVRACLERTNRKNYRCQMESNSMIEILQCDLRFGLPDGFAAGQQEQQEQNGQNGQNGKSDRGEPSERGGTAIEQETSGGAEKKTVHIQTGPVKISQQNCSRAYEHLLSIYRKHPRVEGHPRQQELLEYWKSEEARQSFSSRCNNAFRERDLGCILQTEDPDVIQGCLAQIPD